MVKEEKRMKRPTGGRRDVVFVLRVKVAVAGGKSGQRCYAAANDRDETMRDFLDTESVRKTDRSLGRRRRSEMLGNNQILKHIKTYSAG